MSRKVIPVCIFLLVVVGCLSTLNRPGDVLRYFNDVLLKYRDMLVHDDAAVYRDLVYVLANVSSLPPPAPVSPSCRPPALPSWPDCSGQPGLTGQIMEHPRRLGLMILFGFEVDTLEIALREQHRMVDKVFLVESTKTHKGVSCFNTEKSLNSSPQMNKPLLWERLKTTERFQFLDPDLIVHIVVDVDSNSRDSIW